MAGTKRSGPCIDGDSGCTRQGLVASVLTMCLRCAGLKNTGPLVKLQPNAIVWWTEIIRGRGEGRLLTPSVAAAFDATLDCHSLSRGRLSAMNEFQYGIIRPELPSCTYRRRFHQDHARDASS
jgi:hypothetical protein